MSMVLEHRLCLKHKENGFVSEPNYLRACEHTYTDEEVCSVLFSFLGFTMLSLCQLRII